MAGPQPTPIALTPTQHTLLARLARRQTSSQRLVRRLQIILAAAEGANNEQVGRHLSLAPKTVRIWRDRWLAAAPRLQALEEDGSGTTDLTAAIEAVLTDAPRSGTPPTFSAEQLCQLVALACEQPEDSDRPVTHWTPPELAAEAVKRGIVDRISARTVGRVLKRGQAQAPSGPLLAHQ
jgi:putative transposase